MCRYAEYGPYKEHYACFSCRKMFRRPEPQYLACVQPGGHGVPARCPQCRQPMANLGKDFKAPRQANRERWRTVEALYRHGYTFHSCGCSGPGPRPSRLRDVEPFVLEQARLDIERQRQLRLREAAAERDRLRHRAARAQEQKRRARPARQQD